MDYSSNMSFGQSIIPLIPEGKLKLQTPQAGENLKTLFNLKEAIADRQAEQVAKIAGDLIAEKMNPELSQITLEKIDKFRATAEEMLKENTGARRLSFTPEQKIRLNQLKADIKKDISWGQYITGSNATAIADFERGIRDGTLTEEDSDAVKAIFDQQIPTAREKGIAYIPDPRREIAFLMEAKTKQRTQLEYDKIMSAMRRSQDPYSAYDDNTGMNAASAIVQALTPYRTAQILGFNTTPDVSVEEVSSALNEMYKSTYKPKTRSTGTGSMTISPELDEAGDSYWPVESTGETYSGPITLDDGTEVVVKGGTVERLYPMRNGEEVRVVTATIDNPMLKDEKAVREARAKKIPIDPTITVSGTAKGWGSSPASIKKRKYILQGIDSIEQPAQTPQKEVYYELYDKNGKLVGKATAKDLKAAGYTDDQIKKLKISK